MRTELFLFLCVFVIFSTTIAFSAERFEFEQIEMAVPVRMIVYAPSREIAEKATKEAYEMFSHLNGVMSDYDQESELIRVAQKGDTTTQWLDISDELYNVLAASRKYSEASCGAFEVSVSPIVQLWRRAKRLRRIPRQKEIEAAVERVGLEHWELSCDTEKKIRFKRPGVRFDLGGIAKGYAVDRAFEILQKHGLKSCLVDAGGDMRLGDPPPNKDGWNIEFLHKNERKPDMTPQLYSNIAIAASGDTFQHFILDGKRYSHIVDPRTGYPLTDSKSVTVFAETATRADAVASALSVLEKNLWNEFLKKFPEVRAF